jgi:hypothetical protein
MRIDGNKLDNRELVNYLRLMNVKDPNSELICYSFERKSFKKCKGWIVRDEYNPDCTFPPHSSYEDHKFKFTQTKIVSYSGKQNPVI